MMDGPNGSAATPSDTAPRIAAGDATVDALAGEVSPLDHEASADLLGDQDGATSGVSASGNVHRLKGGPAVQVARPGLCESLLDIQGSSTADTHGEGHPGAIFSGMDGGSPTLTEAGSSSPPVSRGIESGETSYISFEPLIDEPGGKNNFRHYESDTTEETSDEEYRKKIYKGKGKEIAPRAPHQRPVPPVEGRQDRPLNNVPWVQDPERPPQKFPIRFTDCFGRDFVWPWKKAKTWKGAKSLIDSAFLYVEVLGPRVLAGHYDLTVQGMWSGPKTAAINPTLASYPPATTQSSHSALSDNPVDGFGAISSAPSSSFPPGLSPSSSSNVPPHLLPKMPGGGAIILPELWEDVVEPGMLIAMRMRPIATPIAISPSTHAHPPHLPAVPMPPSTFGVAPTFGVGRGRGRGAGSAAGHGSAQPPPPPGWQQQPPRRRGPPLDATPCRQPRGKTRKRQDGL